MMGGLGILGLLVPVLLVVLAVWVISRMFPDWQDRIAPQRREDSAEETLRQRFARGEIDAEEYKRSLEILQSAKVPQSSGAKSA
ncbi:MAG TPA: SHOCT domain-containing protein [Rubrobacter sp.]|nr:SHOCT domain-containing protein [Rubrobacter sp.]